jgi:hypothetical protein
MCSKPLLFDHAAVTKRWRRSGEIEEKRAFPLRNIYLIDI